MRQLPENGFTTNTATMTGKEGYFLTPIALKRVKRAAKFAKLSWQSIAARPATALELVERIEAAQK